MSDDHLERAVRRRVGLAVLGRLRRLVDAEREAEAANARWARRLLWVGVAAAALALAWIAATIA